MTLSHLSEGQLLEENLHWRAVNLQSRVCVGRTSRVMSVPTNITWDLGRAQEGSCGCVLLNSEGEIEV